MKKVEYHFEINREILSEVIKIAEEGSVSYSFMYDLKKLYEESELTPNKDMSWYLGRLISMYYSAELIAYDATFSKINAFLLKEWKNSIPENQLNELDKKLLKNTYTVSF